MNVDDLSSEDYMKYRSFINKRLENEEGLAAVSLRLQHHGLSPEMARELVKEVATEHSRSAQRTAIVSIVGGFFGAILFIGLGISSGKIGNYALAAVGTFFGGIFLFFRSRKRLKYLNSLS